MAKWAMVVDLRKCVGCKLCTAACLAANRGEWRHVRDCGVTEAPERQLRCVPMNCMHCAKAPCLEACPTKATYRRPDGIVDIDPGRCIGCGYCVLACPYRARTLEHGREPALEEDKTDAARERTGTCTKCNFCLPQIEAGLKQGLVPGQSPEATPACVRFCSGGALYFGDLDDPESEVSLLLRENKTSRLEENLETEPSVYYIVPEEW